MKTKGEPREDTDAASALATRAQATLAALKSRLAMTASVRRDGAWKTAPSAELAPGDRVKLALGGVRVSRSSWISGRRRSSGISA